MCHLNAAHQILHVAPNEHVQNNNTVLQIDDACQQCLMTMPPLSQFSLHFATITMLLQYRTNLSLIKC